jgi:hypothetical protein
LAQPSLLLIMAGKQCQRTLARPQTSSMHLARHSHACSCAVLCCAVVCRSLRFEDKPDYAFLRRMFRDLFAKEGE